MITGLHAIVFSPDAEKVRAFFSDTLGLTSVDAGGGWLIFAMPPAELAVHPAGESRHELYLMCDDIHATVRELKANGVELREEITEQRWGLTTSLLLPGGGELGLYEPRHPSPLVTDP
jgi:catechol 2,3-dioxygenase-like lactoylglutathione lyase family enzyme